MDHLESEIQTLKIKIIAVLYDANLQVAKMQMPYNMNNNYCYLSATKSRH